jgi:hypothetical protein
VGKFTLSHLPYLTNLIRQELYKKSRLHQSIQQVHLISYMEGLMQSPLFLHLPDVVQGFFRRRLNGLEGR